MTVAPAIESAPAVLEIGFLLALAVAGGWLARRFGLPAVIGYLAVGLVVSPFTPGYVADRPQLQFLADVGVVLLLFEVGIEINPLTLRKERFGLLWAAPVQTLLTAGLVAAGGLALGLSPAVAVVIGVSVALSSSVVVVNITRSRRRTTNKETEDALLGWSVLQDMTGVAVTLVALAVFGLAPRPPLIAGGLIAGFVLVTTVAAWLLPRVLQALHAEHDLFLMVSVASGLLLAGAGATFFGVPLALAAFVAGLAVGESPVAAEARRRVLPFRDLFAVLFFVLLGSLIDPNQLLSALPWMAAVLAAVVLLKAGLVWVLARLARLPAVRSWQMAIGLGQVGEFSFVLVTLLAARNLIDTPLYTAVLAAVVVSIVLSTTLVRLGRQTSEAPA